MRASERWYAISDALLLARHEELPPFAREAAVPGATAWPPNGDGGPRPGRDTATHAPRRPARPPFPHVGGRGALPYPNARRGSGAGQWAGRQSRRVAHVWVPNPHHGDD